MMAPTGHNTSSRATMDKPAKSTGPKQSRRRNRFLGGSVSALLVGLGMLQSGVKSEYIAGDPVELVITAGDTLEIPFDGSNTAAVGISFQQCSGDSYLRMTLLYNSTALATSTLSTNQCNRIIAGESTADAEEVSTDQLCAFRASAAVNQGYTATSDTINGTIFIDPTDVTVLLRNTGDATASGQMVMFTEDSPAPNVDDSIDRVNTIADLDENTYTVQVDFTASASDEESFCASEGGCALYAYYLEVDEDEVDADLTFGTTCQAEQGTLIYEEIVTTETTATLANAAYQVTACLQFPPEVEAQYRVYLVLSPDTVSYARVGYGIQDQLIFSSGILSVSDDANLVCPEEEEVEETSGAIPRMVPMGRATGAMALSLATAAGHAVARGAEL